MSLLFRTSNLLLLCFFVLLGCAHSSVSENTASKLENVFKPAVMHRGLITAASPLEISKIKTFIVIKKDKALPAERAFYLINPTEYDYRGAFVEGDKVKTRRGEVYTYLSLGTIMGLSDIVYSGRKIYFKMISLRNIKSSIHPNKQPTKVTIMLGFEFPLQVLESNNIPAITNKIDEWLEPFGSLQAALNFRTELLEENVINH